jgi:hypothetical protein
MKCARKTAHRKVNFISELNLLFHPAMRMAVKPPDAIFLDFFHGSNFLGVKGSNPQQLAFLFAKLFLWAMPKKKRSSMPPAAGYRLWLEEADFGPTFFQRVSFA